MPRLRAIAALSAAAMLASACGRASSPAPAAPRLGDSGRGASLMRTYGCGACHVIPGVLGAQGRVGPPLAGMGMRTSIAGVLPNTPDAMVRWLRTPQAVKRGDAMPDMGVGPRDAQDMAAYLASLR